MVLERCPGDGPVCEALDAVLDSRGLEATALLGHERPMAYRRQEAALLSGRRRKTLRRQRRRLEEELGSVTTRDLAATGPGAGVGPFLEMERAGWKGREGTALASDKGHERFFREAMQACAREGRVQSWVLEAGDTTVATLCAVIDGRGAFHLKTAYSEEHGRFSPGVQLELDVLEAFYSDPALDWIDSCTAGKDTPSGLLYPGRRLIQALVVPLRGRASDLAARGLAHTLRLRERLPPGGRRGGVASWR